MEKSRPKRPIGPLVDADSSKRQKALEAKARAHIAKWIGHQEVRANVEALDRWRERLLRPVGHHLDGGIGEPPSRLVAFILAGLRVPLSPESDLVWGGLYPDGAHREGIEAWSLGEKERATLTQRAARYAEGLRRLADRLHEEGVPLDPEDPSNLIVLGQYVYLQPFQHEELAGLSPAQLAAWPIVLASASFSPDWKSLRFSDHVSESERRHLGVLQDRLRTVERGRKRYRDDARASKRRSPAGVEGRRNALRQVLEKHPDVTAASLRKEWSFGPVASAGRLLRSKMGAGPGSTPPSASTLRRDLKRLRE